MAVCPGPSDKNVWFSLCFISKHKLTLALLYNSAFECCEFLETLGGTNQNVASRVFKRQVVTFGIALIVLPSLFAANGVSDVRLAHLELHQLGCQAKCGKLPKSLATLFGTNENVPLRQTGFQANTIAANRVPSGPGIIPALFATFVATTRGLV